MFFLSGLEERCLVRNLWVWVDVVMPDDNSLPVMQWEPGRGVEFNEVSGVLRKAALASEASPSTCPKGKARPFVMRALRTRRYGITAAETLVPVSSWDSASTSYGAVSEAVPLDWRETTGDTPEKGEP